MSRGYQVLPLVYDRWQRTYGRDYSSLILPRVLKSIKRHEVQRGSIVDIACGTGTLALAMARRGWRTWGVDASALMVEEALRKRRPPAMAGFLRQDMRRLHLPEQVHVATCMFDSMNHLRSLREMGRTFSAVAAALQPGGLFIFDLNNEHCYQTLWTRTEAIHQRDFTLIMQNTYHAKRQTGYALVTVFLRRRKGYARLTEVIQERHFPPALVESLLRKSGFRVLEREEFNFTRIKEIGEIKTWWVARKTP
jgi:SAM-dependent methyltransferase